MISQTEEHGDCKQKQLLSCASGFVFLFYIPQRKERDGKTIFAHALQMPRGTFLKGDMYLSSSQA